jgi:hypothetical protein
MADGTPICYCCTDKGEKMGKLVPPKVLGKILKEMVKLEIAKKNS